MLCDRCKIKEAKIYYTEITGGKKIEQHLCEDCAAELTSFQKEIPLESILSGLLGMSTGTSRSNRFCHVCGMSYQEFQKAGKFGCENCYKTFGRLHQGTLKRIQGATAHTGKIAASWQKEQEEAEAAREAEQAAREAEQAAKEAGQSAKEAGQSFIEKGLEKEKQGSVEHPVKQQGQEAEQRSSEQQGQTGQNQMERQKQAGVPQAELPNQTGYGEKAGFDREEELPRLEQELKQAIASEEYEEAARLRDEIRAIRASREKGGCQECQKTD